ncbi:MAG: hypothetical protein IJN17_06710 [Clostridia bacterium]|nr:hypothetical protein [Clostridia bacterium]
MLETLFEIILACLGVYGGYCLTLSLFYSIFCRDKSRICLAYIAKKEKNNFSEIFLAKKAFLGRTRVIILVDCEGEEDTLTHIPKEVSENSIYRAERMDEDGGKLYRRTERRTEGGDRRNC